MPNMLDQLLTSIADAGRDLLRLRRGGKPRPGDVLVRDLLSTRGEASGSALARELIEHVRGLDDVGRGRFFALLVHDFGPDPDRIEAAVAAYRENPGFVSLLELRRAAEPPRQELIRRMNMAPGGTQAIVALRTQLLAAMAETGELRELDADLHFMLTSWFNPGFLTLRRIDWDSPASLLEKLVGFERVHRMRGVEEIRRRLAADRRCFAFFHPALPDEPLIFVQVALVVGMADTIVPLIDPQAPILPVAEADTAVFYSISNCQDGLRGVSLGSFLLKLVVANLAVELPQLKVFTTLSPVPGFAAWLADNRQGKGDRLAEEVDPDSLAVLDEAGWHADAATAEALRPLLLRLCARYLVREKDRRGGRPRDPVARFHLGNGARLERINWLGDPSAKGLAESHGLLVNYRYDPAEIEKNHEAFANQAQVVHSPAVRALLPKLTEVAVAS